MQSSDRPVVSLVQNSVMKKPHNTVLKLYLSGKPEKIHSTKKETSAQSSIEVASEFGRICI